MNDRARRRSLLAPGVVVCAAIACAGACKPSRDELKGAVDRAIDTCASTAPRGARIAMVVAYEPRDGYAHLQHVAPPTDAYAPFRGCVSDAVGKLKWPAGGADVEVVYVGPVPRR